MTDNEYLAAVKKIGVLVQRSIEARMEIGGLVEKVLKDGRSLRGLSADTGVTVATLEKYHRNWKEWGTQRIPNCTSMETYEWASKDPKRKRLLLQGVSKYEVQVQEWAEIPPVNQYAQFAQYLSWARDIGQSQETKEMPREGASYQNAVEEARRLVEVFVELGLLEVPAVVYVDAPTPAPTAVDAGIRAPAGRLLRRSRRAA